MQGLMQRLPVLGCPTTRLVVRYIYVPYTSVDGLADAVFERYITIQKENWFKFLDFPQCMITNFSRRGYVVFEPTEPVLI